MVSVGPFRTQKKPIPPKMHLGISLKDGIAQVWGMYMFLRYLDLFGKPIGKLHRFPTDNPDCEHPCDLVSTAVDGLHHEDHQAGSFIFISSILAITSMTILVIMVTSKISTIIDPDASIPTISIILGANADAQRLANIILRSVGAT